MNSNDVQQTPREFGTSAEQVAVAYLLRRGWRILDTNYHIRQGEIDIIGRDGDHLVFVEVKSSHHPGGWFPGDRIDETKRKHMQIAASHYISQHEIPAGGVRFDAILMTAVKGDEWKIEHIKDAFRVDSNG